MEEWDVLAPCAVTVCDENGIVVRMNQPARDMFAQGRDILLGREALKCHPGGERDNFREIYQNPRSNCYTVDKPDGRKLVYQAPLYKDGVFSGFVELSFPVPEVIRHRGLPGK
jgi:hypothetical protein